MNGEIRDRERKTCVDSNRKRTPTSQDTKSYHNYIRLNESLNGKTPAEACGIQVEGENKWKTLIENVSRKF